MSLASSSVSRGGWTMNSLVNQPDHVIPYHPPSHILAHTLAASIDHAIKSTSSSIGLTSDSPAASILTSSASGSAAAASATVAASSLPVAATPAVAHATARWTSSASPLGALAFLRRLTGAIAGFLLARLKRAPIIASALAKLQEWIERYDYDAFASADPDSFTSRCLDQFIRLGRMINRAIVEFIRLLNWTMDPVLFVRRLYRFCVGILILYCMHALSVYISDRLRTFIAWLRIEKGIWSGNLKCVRKRELDNALATAQTYAEWKQVAMELDELEQERIVWKRTTPSSEYQFKRIAKNVESLKNLIAAHNSRLQPGVSSDISDASTVASNTTVGPPLPVASSSSSASAATAAVAASSTVAAVPAVPTGSPALLSLFPFSKPTSDPQALMRFLRSRLNRNIGNITNSRLYFDAATDHFSSAFPDPPVEGEKLSSSSAPIVPCRVGTKSLIESYHQEVLNGLETILEDTSISPSQKLSFFRETRHGYGRSALLLNGGSNLGLLHLGVVKALLEIDVLPQIICGSSTGAIFAALICSRTDAELSKIGSPEFLSLEFPSVQGSLRRKLRRFLEEGILMDISALIHCVRGHIGDLTFEQAYQRYGRILNIVVVGIHMNGKRKRSDSCGVAIGGTEDDPDEAQHSSEPILLNYLTAPSVLIWSAACASCAVPHLYAPVELLAKNSVGEIVPYFGQDNDENLRFGAGCVDGMTVKMDNATDRLRTLFNCNNFIVSQLNLSLIPFIFGGASFSSAGPLQKLLRYLGREVYQRVTNLCCLFGVTSENITKTTLGKYNLVRIALYIHSLTSQQIFGNITLVPPVSFRDFSQLLENPSTKRLNHCVDVARRYTWTRGSLIKAHCVVEFALDRCVRKVRTEMGLAALPSVSAAFAHPNRNYVNPSPYGVGVSPSTTPVPTNAFWSKKLNARAMQPSRKASFTSDSPTPGMNGIPTLDLGRTSPVGMQRMLPGIGLNSSFAAPSPLSTTNPYGYQGSPPAAAAPRHRSHSTVGSPSHPPIQVSSSPLSPPHAIRTSSGLPSLGVEFVGGSMRPPPTVANPIRRMSLQGSQGGRTPSPDETVNGLEEPASPRTAGKDGEGTGSGDSSRSSTAPSSPIPADSSRDDLDEVATQVGASTVSVSPLSSSASSQTPSRLAVSRASSRTLSASITSRSPSVKPVLLSPTHSQAALANSNDGSLLRSVPSLPGRPGSTFNLTNSGSSSGGTSTSLPSSTSGVKMGEDSFNRGVMAHLEASMAFTMPQTNKKKLPKRGEMKSNGVAASDHKSNGNVAGSGVCPSTSGSDTCTSDVETTTKDFAGTLRVTQLSSQSS